MRWTGSGYGRGRGRKVTIEHMAHRLLCAAHKRGAPLTIGSYKVWRAEILRDPRATPPASESVIQKVATWSVIKDLVNEAMREEDPLASLVEDLGTLRAR